MYPWILACKRGKVKGIFLVLAKVGMSPFTKVKMSPWKWDKKVDKLHTMSEKEIKRLTIMSELEKKQMTQAMAAKQIGMSVRQIKRLWRAYREQGAAGLVNKSRGKPSHNQLSEAVKQQVLDLIVERYRDFGPTLVTEKLVELHRIQISDESVRQMMIGGRVMEAQTERQIEAVPNARTASLFR